ncbi:ATP-binding protein [Vibrio parahaemolyticus]|nr:sensor histidine kinase [Vibrio parahaemolyticus]
MARRLLAKKPFDMSARIPMQLGRESISSSTVAVSELIKNAYDADAEDVKLRFYLRNEPAVSTIVLSDDGNGMDIDTLYNHWLKIGTDSKLGVERSEKKHRVMTGAKGLGRLGLDRLCRKVILYTKKEGEDKVTQLVVDWRKYEGTKASIFDIHHDIYELDLPISDKYGDIFTSEACKGTYMVLVGLRDNWTNEFIGDLKEELRLLISPYRSINDFKIELSRSMTGQKYTTETINSQDILSASSWEIKASVDERGRVEVEFVNNNTGEKIKQSPTEWKHWISNQGEYPLFGPLRFEFHYMVAKKEFWSKVNMSRTNWSEFMKLNQGVRIYRDDFRVRPYGEPNGKGDWLDIGLRKASNPSGIKQGNWKIGPNQIIGAVSISKTKNAILNDQANREGIVENEAYMQLRLFALKVIGAFELLATKEAQTSEDENVNLADELKAIFQKSNEQLSNVVEELDNTFSKKRSKKKKKLPAAHTLYQKVRELKRAQDAHEKAVENYYRELERERKKLKEQKDTLTNLASIGVLTVCFGHEIKTHSAIALENAQELLDVFEDNRTGKSPLDYDDLTEITNDVINGTRYVNSFSELAINNVKPDKRTRKKNNVPEIFKYIFEMMASTFENMGLKYEFRFSKILEHEFDVRSFRIDWESIAINLITNAIWAVSKKPKEDRKIEVHFERVGGTKLRVAFLDSGCGLESGQEESIFLPMQSSKIDRKGNVEGTGMGLSIVKGQVEDNMYGRIYAEQFSPLGGAGFYIEVQQDK